MAEQTIKITRDQGITYALKQVVDKLVKEGKATSSDGRITAKEWSKTLDKLEEINDKRRENGGKSIFSGGTDRNDWHHNFVVKPNQEITFSEEEMNELYAAMGVTIKNDTGARRNPDPTPDVEIKDSVDVLKLPVDSTIINTNPIDSSAFKGTVIDSTETIKGFKDSRDISKVPADATIINTNPIDSLAFKGVVVDSTETVKDYKDSTDVSKSPVDSTIINTKPTDSLAFKGTVIDSTETVKDYKDSTDVSKTPVDSTIVKQPEVEQEEGANVAADKKKKRRTILAISLAAVTVAATAVCLMKGKDGVRIGKKIINKMKSVYTNIKGSHSGTGAGAGTSGRSTGSTGTTGAGATGRSTGSTGAGAGTSGRSTGSSGTGTGAGAGTSGRSTGSTGSTGAGAANIFDDEVAACRQYAQKVKDICNKLGSRYVNLDQLTDEEFSILKGFFKVNKTATRIEFKSIVKTNYRRFATQFHPDKHAGAGADVQEMYQNLFKILNNLKNA